MIIDSELQATLTRARELVTETADAGKNQHKLLTLALLFYFANDVRESARKLGQKEGMSEHILRELDSPSLALEVMQKAAEAAKESLTMGTFIAGLAPLAGFE